MTDMLAEPIERLLVDLCPPERLRAHLAGEPLDALWRELSALGYQDALVSEGDNGLGLGLSDLAETLVILGRTLCPLPLGETMVARALLAQAGMAAPEGPILLITPMPGSDGALIAQAVPLALAASHALLDLGDQMALVSLEGAKVDALAPGRSLIADIVWPGPLAAIASFAAATADGLRPTAAALRAASIAGLSARALELTVDYAATRRQFGKAIGDFQAIQQQLAVLAEEAAAAAMAAAIGCSGSTAVAAPFSGAVAKMRSSGAADRVASIAHAIHGAIGISTEYDLQLYTRRLSEERIADGSELFWAEWIGSERLVSGEPSSVAYVRTALIAA